MLHVTDVRPTGAYRLWIRFSDDAEGEIDLADELDGVVFGPLRDPALFAQVYIDSDVHTVAWPNGADFAPEFLRARVEQRTAA